MAINKPGFIKMGEAMTIDLENTESCLPSVSAEMLEEFRKTAADLKKIAPKAEDFLYFSAVMMHAAEASGLHDDGTPRLNSRGEKVEVGWDKSGGTWRWMSNDSNVKPYKNSNGDIFPEEELVKAYKKWQHKPLCIDHKSSSVDHVRGFIVDTYYDRKLKRVVALCALDKAGYPQLARQVSTGVSNCVSMGTAVGKAICTDCARVARTEADFCDHMRKKSCYGEINVDLNPIELSIVVNGADPRANIKHIIASANTLNTYLEAQASKLDTYQATITNNVTGSPISISGNDLQSFKDDFNRALGELESINSKISEKDTNDMVSNQSPDSLSESGLDDSGLAPPHARYASADVEVDSIADLRKVTAAIELKLNNMKQSLDKLEKTSTKIQEENMSGPNNINKTGYFQGTEEPTPGSPKYTADPLNGKLRTDGDKHMDGQSPFPDTGPVESLYPGDLEKKKLLARAEAEDRAMRRNAIVTLAKQALEDKKAYFQNDDGKKENPGTPTPGKPKYPVDKLNLDARDDDKHMNGKKPFPGVGPVDGLYPEDMKTKDLRSRASYRARFIKVPNPTTGAQDLSKSAWEVFLGDKLLLTASVAELCNGRTDIGYGNIANKEYGAKLIDTVKTFGSEGVKALLKQAQVPPPAEAPAPAAEVPAAEGDMDGEDKGGSGDPKVAALKLAEKVRDLSSDLVEAVRALTGEQAEMGAEEGGAEMGAMASDESFSTTAFNSIRQELNGALTSAIKESIATLNDHSQELEMISGMYDKGAVNSNNEEVVGSLVEDALTEAKSAVADGFKLMTAFVKYARGTKAIVKRAEIEAELNALAEGETMSDTQMGDDLMALINDTNADLGAVADLMGDENDVVDPTLDADLNLEASEGELSADDDLDAQTINLEHGAQVPANAAPDAVFNVKASFDNKEGRAAMRAKLAAETIKFNPILHDAHPSGGTTTDLDTKPSGDGGHVEDLEEKHKAMMDVATAPPKVRKEAEAIHKLVSEGKLDPADLDALVAEGLDKDAVAYWKKFYGQVDGGSEFASELVKEHVKAEIENELNTYKVKLARSYELAYDMADRGLCHHERSAISDQVEEIMKFNDDSFESLKRVVARHAPVMRKEAGRMPQVGFLGDGEINPAAPVDDYAQLSAMFSKNTKRGSF